MWERESVFCCCFNWRFIHPNISNFNKHFSRYERPKNSLFQYFGSNKQQIICTYECVICDNTRKKKFINMKAIRMKQIFMMWMNKSGRKAIALWLWFNTWKGCTVQNVKAIFCFNVYANLFVKKNRILVFSTFLLR